MNKLIVMVALGFFANAALASAPTQVETYGGKSWAGICTNETTAGTEASQVAFDVSAYPLVKLSINGNAYPLTVGTRSSITLASGVKIGVLLELSSTDNFTFHSYSAVGSAEQEQQMLFTIMSNSQMQMKQDSWTYSNGTTIPGATYFCNYTR